jgi:hypothetical protein
VTYGCRVHEGWGTMEKLYVIRFTLWLGIIADAFETIRMSIPNLFIATSGIMVPDAVSFQSGLFLAVPLMLGWTVLLFWADRKPVERRGVLLCLAPVLFTYLLVEFIGMCSGIITIRNLLPTFLMQTVLLCLTIISYLLAEKMYKKTSAYVKS